MNFVLIPSHCVKRHYCSTLLCPTLSQTYSASDTQDVSTNNPSLWSGLERIELTENRNRIEIENRI